MENNTYESKSIAIEGKAYIPVHERIKEFYSKYPFGRIIPEILSTIQELKKGDTIIMRAICYRYPGDPSPGIGHSQIIHGEDFFKTSALEIVETSAVGRALGMMGIGIQGVMASADEVTKSKEQAAAQEKNIIEVKREDIKNQGEIKKHEPIIGKEKTDKKIPNYEILDEKEKQLALEFALAFKISATVEVLKELGKSLKTKSLSMEANEELRKEYNIKMRELKGKI